MEIIDNLYRIEFYSYCEFYHYCGCIVLINTEPPVAKEAG